MINFSRYFFVSALLFCQTFNQVMASAQYGDLEDSLFTFVLKFRDCVSWQGYDGRRYIEMGDVLLGAEGTGSGFVYVYYDEEEQDCFSFHQRRKKFKIASVDEKKRISVSWLFDGSMLSLQYGGDGEGSFWEQKGDGSFKLLGLKNDKEPLFNALGFGAVGYNHSPHTYPLSIASFLGVYDYRIWVTKQEKSRTWEDKSWPLSFSPFEQEEEDFFVYHYLSYVDDTPLTNSLLFGAEPDDSLVHSQNGHDRFLDMGRGHMITYKVIRNAVGDVTGFVGAQCDRYAGNMSTMGIIFARKKGKGGD